MRVTEHGNHNIESPEFPTESTFRLYATSLLGNRWAGDDASAAYLHRAIWWKTDRSSCKWPMLYKSSNARVNDEAVIQPSAIDRNCCALPCSIPPFLQQKCFPSSSRQHASSAASSHNSLQATPSHQRTPPSA